MTHSLLVRHQMFESLGKCDLNLHTDVAFQEVIVDFGLQKLYSLGDGAVSYYVLDRFLHTSQMTVHFVMGCL